MNYNYKSVFRTNHSTNLCLSFFTDRFVNDLDEGLLTDMILIDLRKAFDKINHEILLRKLETIEISNQYIPWFRSYSLWRSILFRNREPTLWLRKGIVWCIARYCHRTLMFLIYLCQRHASGFKIKYIFVCRWLTHVSCTNIEMLKKLKNN